MRCVASLLAQSCVLCLCTRVAGYAPAHNGVRAARPGPTTTTPTVPPAPRARTAAATTKPGAERRSVARRQDAGGKILGTIDRMINLQGDLYQMRGWVRGPHTAAARPSDLVRNPRHPRTRVRTINFSPAYNHGSRCGACSTSTLPVPIALLNCSVGERHDARMHVLAATTDTRAHTGDNVCPGSSPGAGACVPARALTAGVRAAFACRPARSG